VLYLLDMSSCFRG